MAVVVVVVVMVGWRSYRGVVVSSCTPESDRVRACACVSGPILIIRQADFRPANESI